MTAHDPYGLGMCYLVYPYRIWAPGPVAYIDDEKPGGKGRISEPIKLPPLKA